MIETKSPVDRCGHMSAFPDFKWKAKAKDYIRIDYCQHEDNRGGKCTEQNCPMLKKESDI